MWASESFAVAVAEVAASVIVAEVAIVDEVAIVAAASIVVSTPTRDPAKDTPAPVAAAPVDPALL